MAGENTPNVGQDLAQWAARLAAQGGASGKPGFIMTPLGPISLEANVGQGLSMQNTAPLKETVVAVRQAQGGLFAKIFAEIFNTKDMHETLAKIGQAGAVQQASHADLFGQGGPHGGFASNVSGSGRNDIEMG